MCRTTTCLLLACVFLGVVPTASAELVGWWKLDEGSGTAIADSSGNGLDGTFTGGTPQWIEGQYGQAILFNGADGYVNLGRDKAMDLTEEITAALWLKDDGFTTGWQAIFTRGLGWRLQRNAAERNLEWSFPPSPFMYSNGTVDDGEWHHIAGTYDGRRQVLYIDGELDVEQQVSGPGDATDFDVLIGSIDTLTDRVWHGPIDDVRLYSHALVQAEIQAAMNNELYPFASRGTPVDGAMVEETSATLEWWPGESAVSHTVYFGTSFDEVDNGTATAWPTTAATLSVGAAGGPCPDGLVPGQTYYWRVDEVDNVDPGSPWKGAVWSFTVRPSAAWDASPANGDEYVLTDQSLTWKRGMGTLFHTLYFGTSFEEVNEAAAGGAMITDPVYSPDVLDTETTYYWRVDEFTQAGVVRGDVWSFTTLPEVAVAEDPNLLLWWTLAEGSGTTAVDWSGHGHHGALHGDTQWIDGTLAFNGGEFVGTLLDVPETEGAVAFWFKTTDPQCGLYTVVVGDLAAGGGWDRAICLIGGELTARIYAQDRLDESVTTAGLSLADGAWHHAVHMFGASVGGQKLYVDGVERASGPKDVSDFTWQDSVNIGWSRDAANAYLTGMMEEVRIYNKTLTDAEVGQIMRGDPTLAWNPEPARSATADIRDTAALRWNAGEGAVSHDVYFGTDRDAVAAADKEATEYQGSQSGTSFSVAGMVEFGGGDYYWRIDEIAAGGTVVTGDVWKFTVADYLVIDNFESYTNEVGARVFETWVDGVGFTQPEPGNAGNGTGAMVGHDIWSVDSPYFEGTLMETADVHGGGKAMPVYYDNTFSPYYSEVECTFMPSENWTAEGVTTLVVCFRGAADNTGQLYARINGTKVPYAGDAADLADAAWTAWNIDLASLGVSLTNVTTLAFGVEGGDTGVFYVDDVRLTKP